VMSVRMIMAAGELQALAIRPETYLTNGGFHFYLGSLDLRLFASTAPGSCLQACNTFWKPPSRTC
jgi:hypothetical protein